MTWARQYAYIPQDTKAYHSAQLTYAQNAPNLLQRTNGNLQQSHTGFSSSVVPPSISTSASSRFKPVVNRPFSNNQSQRIMGPPPTPQRTRNANGQPQANSPTSIPNKPTYLPPSRRETNIPATPVPGQHISGAVPGRFFNPREPLRPPNPTLPTGGHRTPFISRPSLGGQHNNGFV